MKNKHIFLLLFCFLLVGAITFNKNVAFASELNQVKVIYSNVNIYYDYNDLSKQDNVIKVVNYGEILQTNTQEIYTNSNKLNFYKVVLNEETNNYGYILVSHTADVNLSSPKRELDYNAKLRKKTSIYLKDANEELYQTSKVLNAGEKIKILNKMEEYSFIQYLDQDNNILSCYIKTNCIKVNGVSRSTISAIIIITTTVSLVLIIFGVNKRKSKKSKLFKN